MSIPVADMLIHSCETLPQERRSGLNAALFKTVSSLCQIAALGSQRTGQRPDKEGSDTLTLIISRVWNCLQGLRLEEHLMECPATVPYPLMHQVADMPTLRIAFRFQQICKHNVWKKLVLPTIINHQFLRKNSFIMLINQSTVKV